MYIAESVCSGERLKCGLNIQLNLEFEDKAKKKTVIIQNSYRNGEFC